MGGKFWIDRDIFEHEIWQDIVKFRIFFYIVGKAAYKDDLTVGGVRIKRGQYLRSYRNLLRDLEYKEKKAIKQYSISTLQRKIQELVSEKILDVTETDIGTLFTVVDYEELQAFLNTDTSVLKQQRNSTGTVPEHSRNSTGTIRIKENKDNNANNYLDAAAHAQETTMPTGICENDRNMPAVPSRAEAPKRNTADVADSTKSDVAKSEITQLFMHNIKPTAGPLIIEKLCGWLDVFPPEVIKKAIEEAVVFNARSYGYVEQILNAWDDKGLHSIELVNNHLHEWDDKKKQASQGDKVEKKPNNRFINFKQREWDYEEIEKMEREYIINSLNTSQNESLETEGSSHDNEY